MNNPAAQAKKDPVLAKVEYAQALAMLCYYPLEHYCPSHRSSPPLLPVNTTPWLYSRNHFPASSISNSTHNTITDSL